LLSLARRESYQCNARHKSDRNDLEFGFHIGRNYSLFTPHVRSPKMENEGNPRDEALDCEAVTGLTKTR
jgi:hypothetical protein